MVSNQSASCRRAPSGTARRRIGIDHCGARHALSRKLALESTSGQNPANQRSRTSHHRYVGGTKWENEATVSHVTKENTCYSCINVDSFPILTPPPRTLLAIKNGVCRVGLTPLELEDLARAGEQGRAEKCSTRELSLFLSSQYVRHEHAADPSTPTATIWGATTVASTMKLAHLAGISTFITGGIGGVHRHGEVTMDVSADLTELSRTPIVVVSAGIKSILDIRKTLEVLETNGVPTIAYQTDEFPAFFSPSSGISAPMRMDSCHQIATAYWIAQELGLAHGMLVGVPNSDPAGANVEAAIQLALEQAESQGITGRSVTPFVLKRVAEQTQGDSLRSNIALVVNNANVGADIACAIASHHATTTRRSSVVVGAKPDSIFPTSEVVVIGGAVLDIVAKPVPGLKLVLGTSNPSVCTESDGGVGRNIAEVLGRLGSRPLLYTAVGNDSRGLAMLDRLNNFCGVSSTRQTVCLVDKSNTSTYVAVLNEDGDLHTACADMTVLDRISPPPTEVLEKASMLVMDANPPMDLLRESALRAVKARVEVFLDPTSTVKARKVSQDEGFLSCLTYASPNLAELIAMSDCQIDRFNANNIDIEDINQLGSRLVMRMNPVVAHLLVTCGANGVVLVSKENSSNVTITRFPALTNVSVKNTSGAGDTLAGAFIHSILKGCSVKESVSFAIDAAALSLECPDRAISPQLSSFSSACQHRA